jgi:hypothetical protein
MLIADDTHQWEKSPARSPRALLIFGSPSWTRSLAFLLDGVPEAERIARCRDRLCAKIAHSQSLTQKPTSPDHRLPLTAFETPNGRSTFAMRTAATRPIEACLLDLLQHFGIERDSHCRLGTRSARL